MGSPRETVLSALENLAPLHLAESWDNVGLLIDPGEQVGFEHALITIDLTDEVLEEALERQADLIVAYHPPIFSGLKRLRHTVAKERIVLRTLRSGLTVYSPHTALDAASGGMGDWLARALGPGRVTPIVPHVSDPRAGAGRFVRLDQPVTVERAVELVKAHLALPQLRLSRGAHSTPIASLAVCPGAGGAVFEQVRHADLLLTGEMRHHDLLERAAQGTSVILTDHTNTERGYLPHLAQLLVKHCPGLAVSISARDRDPLQVL